MVNNNILLYHFNGWLPCHYVHQLITMCGTGALGGNLSEMLARMGIAQLKSATMACMEVV